METQWQIEAAFPFWNERQLILCIRREMGPMENAARSGHSICAILTTEANELLSDVHDRMPVILKPETYQEWPFGAASKCGHLTPLLRPFQAALMTRFPVGSAVNGVQNDTRECIKEV